MFDELKDALGEALFCRVRSRAAPTGDNARTVDGGAQDPTLQDKIVSTPPTGESSKVTDLTITDTYGTYTLSWHYRNLGDYDQDGTVGISDITPIAMHYGETYDIEDVNCLLAVIDGNGNGAVDIADVAPIAMNLGADCAGYMITESGRPIGYWQEVEPATLDETTGNGRLEFTHSIQTPRPGMHYGRVVPFDTGNAPGISSEPAWMPSQKWVHTWGGYASDDGVALTVDGSGNAYIAAISTSFSAGNCVLLKYDPCGRPLWRSIWSGCGFATGFGLASDRNGNVYLSGHMHGVGVEGLDITLLKYEPGGDLLWQKTWGGNGDDYSYCLSTDDDNNVYLAGATDGYGAGSLDLLLLKLDAEGSLLWQKTWGGAEDERGDFLSIDGSGNVYVTGRTRSFGAGSSDVILLKYDLDGNSLWQKTWGGSSWDDGRAVAIDETGNAYVTGRTSSFGIGNYTDIFLLKFDPGGSLLWQNLWGGNDADGNSALALDEGERIYVTGGTYSFQGGNGAVLLLEYSLTGELLSQRIWGGTGNDCGTAIAIDGNGMLYIGGSASNTYGFWQDVTGQTSSPVGVIGTPSGLVSTPSCVEIIPDRTVVPAEGIEDAGGGCSDALLMKLDPSSL